ncbi:MAG: fatty acid synthase subunit beta domain-containing protein, partial [Aeromicrobium sp.]
QIEGGKAGGHHSWEDLDELLLTTYADLRSHDNIVLVVGGGVGTPDAASAYIGGTWAHRHGYPAMPIDGVLVATAAMATREATTSPEVKQLLVDTPGTPEWIGAGTAVGGMASSRSQLGADIHEIDNTASQTGRLLDEVAGDAEAIEARRDEIIEALNRTSKPYFGDVEAMTYAQWLARFVELSGTPAWLDVTLRDRFHAMLQRAEARLHEADHGDVPTLFASSPDVEFGAQALQLLLKTYPHANDVVLHPADVPFFITECKRLGKPVNFVPVIDADIRRWWRSDSLWQAHEARYAADGVCVIPGPVSVAGIDRVDEPVADLLRRFESTVVDDVVAGGRAPLAVTGRRRVDDASEVLSLALAAPDVVWAGRTVRNPVQRLGDGWVLVDADRAEHPETGAVIVPDGRTAVLSVPLARDGEVLTLHLDIGDDAPTGAVPVVTTEDATTAMRSLTAAAAAGITPSVEDGLATVDVTWDPDLVADHAGVVGVDGRTDGTTGVPDVLVGLAWPAVFAAVADSTTADGHPVVEGMLDLVHLDHAVDVTAGLPQTTTELSITASTASVADTDMGRVVTVDVVINAGGRHLATLVERFAVRGRPGDAELVDPVRAGGTLEDPRETPRRSRASAHVEAPDDLRAFAAVTGDHNPIHTSLAAARLAGLGDPIVHGMWISAAAQRVLSVETGRRISGWTSRFMSPVRPGARVDIRADRVGLESGDEVVDVTCRVDGEVVMSASGRLAAPRTAYVFPGQGIQHAGMGMEGYQRSKAARAIWDRADEHTRKVLGFSILTVVRDNPTEIIAAGTSHRHPDGVLFLTQFTQVAMAV